MFVVSTEGPSCSQGAAKIVIDVESDYPYNRPTAVAGWNLEAAMDTSVLLLDLPAWLSGATDAVYVASLFLALFAIIVLGCTVAQIRTVEGQSVFSRNKT